MADILHDLVISATPARVFAAVSTAEGLDRWWTKKSAGEARVGEKYQLWFGPEWDWKGEVTQCQASTAFELRLVEADEDWTGTVVGFRLRESSPGTWVQFYHQGWPEPNDHFRRSSYCWAMYLRVLKRYLEQDEDTPYEVRTGV